MDDDRKSEPVNESAYRAAILVWVVLMTTAALSTLGREERARIAMPTINQASVASITGTPPADPQGGEPQGNVVDLTY